MRTRPLTMVIVGRSPSGLGVFEDPKTGRCYVVRCNLDSDMVMSHDFSWTAQGITDASIKQVAKPLARSTALTLIRKDKHEHDARYPDWRTNGR
jgi:hypothetical protein